LRDRKQSVHIAQFSVTFRLLFGFITLDLYFRKLDKCLSLWSKSILQRSYDSRIQYITVTGCECAQLGAD